MNILFYSKRKEVQKLTQLDPWLINIGTVGYRELLRSKTLEVLKLSKSQTNDSQSIEIYIKAYPKNLEEKIVELLSSKKTSMSEQLTRNLLDTASHFQWKIDALRQYSRKPKRICSVGPGQGYELVYLRLAFPFSEIYYIDHVDQVDETIKTLVSANRIGIDLMEDNKSHYLSFDMIFSNHCLEHFCDPISVLKRMLNLAKNEGIVATAIPTDLDSRLPLSSTLLKLINNPELVTLFDGPLLDIGHSLKLDETFLDILRGIEGFFNTIEYKNNNQGSKKVHPLVYVSALIRRWQVKVQYSLYRGFYLLMLVISRMMHPNDSHTLNERRALSTLPWSIRNYGRENQNKFNQEKFFITIKD
jgi:2-polyprenyl-3-methyl-5-hydroxy-6-metoxy-1,4-benzoquinol methylase